VTDYSPIGQDKVIYEQRVLERLKFASAQAVDGEFFRDSLAFGASEDRLFGNMLFRLRAEVLADKVASGTEVASISVPATWWDHFKQDVALRKWPLPAWLRQKITVSIRMTRHTADVDFTRYRTYPECNILFPKEYGRSNVYEVVNISPWRKG